jgi:cytochrome c biogenesis protein CcmG, thiol:disulfide interchange protein DsbE
VRFLGWVAGGLVAAVLLAAAGWGMLHPAGNPPATLIGKPAPELVVSAFDGSTLRLSDLRGRPVVVNFWASWCAPCRLEDPALQAAARAHAGQVQFLGVTYKDSLDAARAYAADSPHPYPLGSAEGGVPSGFGVTGPPETYFIDPQGVVAARFLGPLDGQSLDHYLELIGVGGP